MRILEADIRSEQQTRASSAACKHCQLRSLCLPLDFSTIRKSLFSADCSNWRSQSVNEPGKIVSDKLSTSPRTECDERTKPTQAKLLLSPTADRVLALFVDQLMLLTTQALRPTPACGELYSSYESRPPAASICENEWALNLGNQLSLRWNRMNLSARKPVESKHWNLRLAGCLV